MVSMGEKRISPNEKQPFEKHLEELRYRLKIIAICVGIITLALMIIPGDLSFLENPLEFYKPLIAVILDFIRTYALPKGVELIGMKFMAPIELYLISSFILGIVISMPIIIYEAYKFVDPALYPHEKQIVYPYLMAFGILFAVGALFGLFLLVPFLIKASLPFYSIVGAHPLIYVSDFYGLVFIVTLLTGFAFTFPVIFVLLVRLGFIDTSIITKNRGIFYVALFILTAIITPDGGPIADFALFIPMVLLMEGAVIIAKKYEKSPDRLRRNIFAKTSLRKCPYCGCEFTGNRVFCPCCGRALK